jgi:hypothetical protein
MWGFRGRLLYEGRIIGNEKKATFWKIFLGISPFFSLLVSRGSRYAFVRNSGQARNVLIETADRKHTIEGNQEEDYEHALYQIQRTAAKDSAWKNDDLENDA